jgi:hypothetical protein
VTERRRNNKMIERNGEEMRELEERENKVADVQFEHLFRII